MGKPKRNRMQIQIDNEPTPTSPPKSMSIDKWSLSSVESKSIKLRAENVVQLHTKQGADSLLRKTKKKPKALGAKAKKRQEQGVKRAMMIKEKEEIKIAKSLEKLNKKKHLKTIWE